MDTKNEQIICIKTELRKEFVRRYKKNPAYSIRSFAKHLGVDQSMLSKVMNGHKQPSVNIIEKIAPKLGIMPSQMPYILQANVRPSSPDYWQLADDEVSLLSNWSHFAILELIKTKDFRLEKKYIARRLGLHSEEVADALNRLERMNFIEINHNRIEIKKPNTNWSNTSSTTVARQDLQKSLLTKAMEAIEEVPYESRLNGSLTVSIRSSRLPEFRQKLTQIRSELDAFFQPNEDESEFDEVYQLNMSFFPLTKKDK